MSKNNLIQIGGELVNTVGDGIIADAAAVKDYTEGKTQATINAEMRASVPQVVSVGNLNAISSVGNYLVVDGDGNARGYLICALAGPSNSPFFLQTYIHDGSIYSRSGNALPLTGVWVNGMGGVTVLSTRESVDAAAVYADIHAGKQIILDYDGTYLPLSSYMTGQSSGTPIVDMLEFVDSYFDPADGVESVTYFAWRDSEGWESGETALATTDQVRAKQDVIDDLSTIRSGAAAGATAVQPAALQEGLATKQDTITDLAAIRSGAAAGATAAANTGDKAYNAAAFSGLGRVNLQKNIVEVSGTDKNVLTQAMVNTANTIYHIQYDYDLNGQTITLPAGCVLEFDGGSVKNGTISLNNCSIIADGTIFGDNITISGKCLQEASPDWFAGTDADKIEKAIAAFSCVKLSSRDYIITRTIKVTKSFSLKGASIPDFFGDYSNARADMSASRLIASMNNGTMFLIRGTELTSPSAYGSFVVESVAFGLQAGISAGAVDGLTFTSYGGPSRPVVIRNCNFKALGKAISFDTSDYNSSTTGTSCGTITIENNNIIYCNYGIYGAGRYSVGLCVIRQNNIEQNTQCGIYFNHEQSFGVVGLSSLSIVDNQLEGQTEAVNVLANGSFITISGNYFERAGGQHIRVKQTSSAPLTICNNSISNGALNIHCEGVILYARANVRSSNYAALQQFLYLKNVRIVENDIKIAECTGFILSARETATEKSFPIIARSNEALDAVRLGKFMKKIPVSSGLVQLPLSVTSYAAGTYTIVFLLNAPRTIDAEPYLVCMNTSTYETTLPVKSMAISDEMYVVQFCVTLTSTSNIRVYVRNYSATTLIYVSDVVVVDGVADGIIKTIYDTINVNQPSLTVEDKGANYFDSPLNEALFFNGSAWASAYGRIASQPRVVSDSSPSVIDTALDTTYVINGTLGNVTINLPAVTDGKPHKIVINGKTDVSPVFSYSSSDGKGIAYEYGYALAASTLYEITCRFNGAKWIVSLLKLQTSIILPAGYTEIPYIEAQNGAYINTGYIPNANSEFEADFMPLVYNKATDMVFGSRNPQIALFIGSTTSKLYPIWGTTGFTANVYDVTNLMGTRWKVILNSSKFTYNGTEATITSASVGTPTQAVYLFTINDDGSANGSYMKGRMYGFKIKESGVVLHNFIPCIDPNNVVGMYDTIGGQFYGSANAQPFTAGE